MGYKFVCTNQASILFGFHNVYEIPCRQKYLLEVANHGLNSKITIAGGKEILSNVSWTYIRNVLE